MAPPVPMAPPVHIAPPGGARSALADLPLAALRLEETALDGLARLGLRRVAELDRLPRAAVTRRFGADVARRLDQAFGAAPEPVAPVAPPPRYAARLSLPEPIGRLEDLAAGLERLMARLCARLEADQIGARRLRFSARRVDQGVAVQELSLARPGRDPARLTALLTPRLERLDIGFGVDALRLQALETEPLGAQQIHAGPSRARGAASALDDLLTRLGGELGLERLQRFLPAESWVPEKAAIIAAAAYSTPSPDWRAQAAARPERPLERFVTPEPLAPEPLTSEPLTPEPAAAQTPPAQFEWRGRTHRVLAATGPERIAPEWWLDDPDWRAGPRDYWRVETDPGGRLWLFHTPQGASRAPSTPSWFVAGRFA